MVCALVSGMAPLVSLRSNLNETLKEGGRSEESGARAHRMRGLLVVCEVALAAVALIGAGLFVKSFHGARALDPGFDPNNVLVARFALADTGYPVERQQEFCRRLRQRLEAAPGVTAVNYADVAPLGFDQRAVAGRLRRGLRAGERGEHDGLPHARRAGLLQPAADSPC